MSQPAVDEVEQHRMPLLEHLKELRNRLVISIIALIIGMLISLAYTEWLYAMLTAPVRQVLDSGIEYPEADALYAQLSAPIRTALANAGLATDERIKGTLAITSSPLEGMYTYLRVGLVGGAVLASPVMAYQAWGFIAPGLYASERKVVLPLTFASTFLFLSGAMFAYAVIFPVAFPFFFAVLDAQPMLSIDGYLSTIVRILLAFGLCFQLPVATWFLARMGLIDAKDMIVGFRYAIVAVFVVAAIITPPDILTQILLGVPMVILYAVGIVVAWVWSTKERDDGATTADS
ncbi:MAG: twin-arginine translocase subunit TatC [Deltaproteobacteria bacterium]|nr:MAG: twin-arginine translocase subunit TatC [Deltaproteobacteria bacterium]